MGQLADAKARLAQGAAEEEKSNIILATTSEKNRSSHDVFAKETAEYGKE